MNLAEINKAELDNGDTMSEYEIVEIPLDTRLCIDEQALEIFDKNLLHNIESKCGEALDKLWKTLASQGKQPGSPLQWFHIVDFHHF